ncbi:hypothetical protein Bbelb_003220 [Branchiostoma belcheri]|nr:hypothetical protein Bbelb_003220 [Branchiostoma belcheri]
MFVLALLGYLNLQNSLILGCVFLLTYWYIRTRTPPNLPPGPWALPVLGNVAQIFTKAPYKLWMKLAKEYGPVIYLWLGSQQIVVLNTYTAIHEALVKKGEDFSNRPALHTFKQMGLTNNGIVLLPYGPFFKQQRKFTIMGLRDFGFGKRSLEGKIVEESQELREEILKKRQKPFNIRRMLQNAVGNVICSIVLGKRFEYDDEKLEKIMRAFDQNTGDQRLSRMADFFPWARHIPVIKRAVAKYVKDVERCVGIFREDIAAHKETFDPNDIRDFIDTFLLEMKNKEGEEGNDFTDRQLEYLIRDLFLAGEESTSNTLNWALLYMLRHPDVQKKVQQEIDSTIGQDVTPSFSHRSQLPYTEAVTMEVMRINPIAPLSAIHATSTTPPCMATTYRRKPLCSPTCGQFYMILRSTLSRTASNLRDSWTTRGSSTRGTLSFHSLLAAVPAWVNSWPGWSCFCSSPPSCSTSPSNCQRAHQCRLLKGKLALQILLKTSSFMRFQPKTYLCGIQQGLSVLQGSVCIC